PAARVDLPPVGARQVRSLEEYSVPLNTDSVPVIAAQIASEAPPASGKPLGWAPMFALVAGGAFILAAGAYLGVRVLAPQQAAARAPAAAGPAEPGRPAEGAAAAPATGPARSNVIELDVQPIDGQQAAPTAARRAPVPPGAATEPKKKELTAE